MSRSQRAMDNNKRGKFIVQVKASNPDGLSSTSVVEVRHFHPCNFFIHSFCLVYFGHFLTVLFCSFSQLTAPTESVSDLVHLCLKSMRICLTLERKRCCLRMIWIYWFVKKCYFKGHLEYDTLLLFIWCIFKIQVKRSKCVWHILQDSDKCYKGNSWILQCV